MEILYLLIPLAVALLAVAIVFFLWTVRSGQYDDLEGPAHRILMDDDDPLIPNGARQRSARSQPPRPESDADSAAPHSGERPSRSRGDRGH